MMSIKVRLIALLAAVLLVPCFATAENTYELYPFTGSVEFMAYSNGSAYIQATVEYPQSAVYQYHPQTMSTPAMIVDTLTAEVEKAFVLNNELYIYSPAADCIKSSDEESVYDLLTKGGSPFLVSIYEDDALVYVMAHGEELHVCRLDTLTGEIQSVNMGVSLFAIQPYGEQQSLLVNTDGTTGEKVILELDWNTLVQSEKGRLPMSATSIAYSKAEDCIYYMADGCLWSYQWNGTKQQVASGFPLWTDQRAFILNGGTFTTLYFDLEEALLTIDLNNFSN